MINRVKLERVVWDEAAESIKISREDNNRSCIVQNSTAQKAIKSIYSFINEVKEKTGYKIDTMPAVRLDWEGGLLIYFVNDISDALLEVSHLNGADYSFRLLGRQYEGKLN